MVDGGRARQPGLVIVLAAIACLTAVPFRAEETAEADAAELTEIDREITLPISNASSK